MFSLIPSLGPVFGNEFRNNDLCNKHPCLWDEFLLNKYVVNWNLKRDEIVLQVHTEYTRFEFAHVHL